MIHTIYIDDRTDLTALKKEFRKCLMTGGAVIRIKDGLDEVALNRIKKTFLPTVEPHNISSMVILELEKHQTKK